MSGETAAQSKVHFLSWLDQVAHQTLSGRGGDYNVKFIKGTIIKSVFHQISASNATTLHSTIQSKLLEWGNVCANNNVSCGTVLQMTSSETGMCHFKWAL